MSKFDSCLTSLNLRDSLPVDALRATAAEYQEQDSLAPAAALLRAAEEHLDMAMMEEQDIVRTVREQYEARGGKKRKAAPAPAAAEVAAPAEPKPAAVEEPPAPILLDITDPKDSAKTDRSGRFNVDQIESVLSDIRAKHGVKLPTSAKLWRGESELSGGGMATYGLGLYITADKSVAKDYAGDDGRVVEMDRTDLPENPLRFDSVNDFQVWYGYAVKRLGFKSKTEIASEFSDFADFVRAIEPSFDGMQIGVGKSAIFVNYGPSSNSELLDLTDQRTIEVDGERRPIKNSHGQLVAKDFAGQVAFWKFYKNGPVDSSGRPLALYHGTNSDVTEMRSRGEQFPDLPWTRGIYFTSDPEYASAYADREGANVMPVYVSMQNPKIITDGFFASASISQEQIDALRAEGFDSIINEADNEYIVFDGRQVKSAVGNVGTFDPAERNIMLDLAEISPLMAGAVSEEEAPKRVAAVAKLKAARRRLNAGEITEGDYRLKIDGIIASLGKRNGAAVSKSKPRERGPDWVIERLMRARRTGEIDEPAVNFALWALDKNPQLATDLGISLRQQGQRGAAGMYEPIERVITLFRGGENSGTVVHEILHHTERMMPADIQAKIVKAWQKAFARAHTDANEQTRSALNDMLIMVSDKEAKARVIKAISYGVLDYKTHYQLASASEYWAVNATRIMSERHAADSWVAKAKQWFKELMLKVRGWLGLRPDAAVLKGLQAVLNGTGEKVSPRMLVEQAYATRDIEQSQDPESGDGPVLYDIPRWLRSMPQATQDAAKKAGLWAPQVPLMQKLKSLRANAWTEFVQGMFDQFSPLAKLDYKSYLLARLTKSADAPLETILLYGKPFLNSAGAIDLRPEHGGLAGVLAKLDGEHDRFFAWIAGNRAAKLKKEGRENLFTDTDITALKDLNQGQMADGSSRQRLYERTRIEFNSYSKAVMDIAEQAGIIDGASRALWESDFYVPFYRMAEDTGKTSGPSNIGGMTDQYAFKKLKGGTDNLSDLMHNTMRNWSHLLSASLKNQAAASAIRAAEAQGIADPVAGSQKDSVFFLENGEPKHYVVHDTFIMDAITALEWAGWNNPIMKGFQKAKHYLTMGVTISPEFKIVNLARDQLAAVAQTPVSANIMKNLVEGWQGTDKESIDYSRMLTGGGLMRFGTFLEGDRAEHVKRLIEKGIPSAQILTTSSKIKNFLPAAWDAWQEVGDRSENITRAAIYKQYRGELETAGFSNDEAHLVASFAARDSMDFSLQGKWATVRFLAQLVPFLNARLQGLYKLGRDGIAPSARMIAPQLFGQATTSDKRKALRFGSTVLAVSLASVALMMAQAGDDDYDALEEWQRDAYWCIKVGDKMFFIPKPFEIGAMGTIAERGVEAMMHGMDKESRALFAERMKAMVFSTFAMNPTPQLVKPMIDLYANKNSFTGRPIETPDMENRSKSERIGQRTTATAQLLGKATGGAGLSPVQIDHLVAGYFGWLGTHVVLTTDFATRPLMGLPEQAERRWPDDYIVVGRFVKDLPAPQTKYVTQFYDHAQEVQQAMGDIRYYQSMGIKEKVKELRQENIGLLKLGPLYQAAQRQLGDLNKEIKLTQYRKLTPEEKRERIEKLTAKKNQLTKHVEELRVKRDKQTEAEEVE
jgi:hypothetical protein